MKRGGAYNNSILYGNGYGRFTISKYHRGIGAIKCKGLPHTPRGQSKGDCFYIGNKIRAKKKSTVCKKEIPFMVMEESMIVMILIKV